MAPFLLPCDERFGQSLQMTQTAWGNRGLGTGEIPVLHSSLRCSHSRANCSLDFKWLTMRRGLKQERREDEKRALREEREWRREKIERKAQESEKQKGKAKWDHHNKRELDKDSVFFCKLIKHLFPMFWPQMLTLVCSRCDNCFKDRLRLGASDFAKLRKIKMDRPHGRKHFFKKETDLLYTFILTSSYHISYQVYIITLL